MTRIIIALPLAIVATTALAADDTAPGFHWNTQAQLGYDDNVYRTNNNTESDGFVGLKPVLGWLAFYGAHQFDLSYAGDYNVYFNEDDLTFYGHHFGARALLDHSTRLTSEFTAGHQRGVDRPGNTDGLRLPGETPDKWRDDRIQGKIRFGSNAARGQLEGRLRFIQRDYTNNNQDYRDVDTTGATATFYYRLAPRTRLLLEVDYADYDYSRQDVFGADQGGDQWRYLTGVAWEATDTTTGILKIGYRERSYDDDRYDSQDGLALFLDGTWDINSYTRVAFGAAVDNQFSARQGTNGYEETSVHTSIIREITPITRLKADLRYVEEEFDDVFNREDNRWELGLGFDYSLLSWLDIGAAYRYKERDSELDIYEFSANIFVLTARTTY